MEIGRAAEQAEVEKDILHRIWMRGNAAGGSGHRGADDTAAFASGARWSFDRVARDAPPPLRLHPRFRNYVEKAFRDIADRFRGHPDPCATDKKKGSGRWDPIP